MKFMNKIISSYLSILFMIAPLSCVQKDLQKENNKLDSIVHLEQKKKEITNPEQAQDFINTLNYDFEDGNIDFDKKIIHHYELDSPKVTLKEGKAHCYEGALLVAYLLEDDGYEDEILRMDNETHAHGVFIYKKNNLFGAVGKSRYKSLQGRKPKYKTLNELVESYNKPLMKTASAKYGKFTSFHLESISKKYPLNWALKDKPLIYVNNKNY